MVFLNTILQPTGLPFLIFKNTFKCLDIVILPFLDVINSKANKLDTRGLKFDFLYPKFNVIFVNLGMFIKFV